MAVGHTLVIAGDPDQARDAVHRALIDQGFTVSPGDAGQSTAERGSRSASVMLGSLTDPKRRYLHVTIAGQAGEDGDAIVTLTAGTTGWSGGIAAKTQAEEAYRGVFARVAESLREADLLRGDEAV